MPIFIIFERTGHSVKTFSTPWSHSAVTQGETEWNGGGGWEARRRAAQPACHSGMMDEPIPWLAI